MTSTSKGADFDEAAELKALQKDAQTLARRLESLSKLKPGDAKAIDALEQALSGLPTGSDVGNAVDELRKRAQALLENARAQRAADSRSIESDFLRKQRESGETVRESGEGAWRVGPVEVQLDRERARARVLYNREAVSAWSPIGKAEDLSSLVSGAIKKLSEWAIPDEDMSEIFWAAYEHLRQTSKGGAGSATRVPLPEFYKEVRVVMTRHELRAGKPDRKLSRSEFPKWAFLHNLDRYRRLVINLPADHRLTLETGSQNDHQKGMSMIVNGLDAKDDYKSYCYVLANSGAAR